MAEEEKWKKIKYEHIKFIKKLGEGNYGEVFLATIKDIKGLYAIKRLPKSKFSKSEKAAQYLRNEIEILKDINHENIVKLYNSDIETFKYKFLITEYCNGDDLNNSLEYYKDEKGRPFNEEEVQHIMRQILSGLNYLHFEKKILHRDLKLENILLHYEDEEDRLNKRIMKAKVKIIDFGFARYLYSDFAKSILGSPIYMDPKILLKYNKLYNYKDFGYDQKADVYSLGVIFYQLITGDLLFDVKNLNELVAKTNEGEYMLPANLSKETVSFANYMLRDDAKKRLNVDKLIKHKFITKNIKEFNKIDKHKLGDNLKGSNIIFNIKKTCIEYINQSVFEKEENEKPDEFQQELIDKFNNIKIKPKPKPVKEDKKKSLEDLFLESFDIINGDAMRIEQKLIPFIPGISSTMVLEDL